MKGKKNNNEFATILSSLLIIMLVVLVIGFLFFRTDNFTTSIKSFYVKNGGNTFVGDYDNFSVVIGKEYKFEIINTIDNFTNTDSEYKLSIVPNYDLESTNFKYSVDNVTYNFHNLESLSTGFEIFTYNDYFTFKATNDLPEIMKNFYWGKTLTGVPTTIDSKLPYYRLEISSIGENSVTININFNLKSE